MLNGKVYLMHKVEGIQTKHVGGCVLRIQPEIYRYLKSVTFYVNPDQWGLLVLGAQYHSAPDDPLPVVAPFGSGCMQLVSLSA